MLQPASLNHGTPSLISSSFSRSLRILVLSAVGMGALAGCEKEDIPPAFVPPEHLSKPVPVQVEVRGEEDAMATERAFLQMLESQAEKVRPELRQFCADSLAAYKSADALLQAAKVSNADYFRTQKMVEQVKQESGVLFSQLGGLRKQLTVGEPGKVLPRDTRKQLSVSIQSVIDILMYNQTIGDRDAGNATTSNSNITAISALKAALAEGILDCANMK